MLCTVGSLVSGLHSPGCRTLNSLDSRVFSPFFILRGGNRPRYRDFCQSCHGRLFSDGQTRQFRLPGLGPWMLRNRNSCGSEKGSMVALGLLNSVRNSLSRIPSCSSARRRGWDGQKIVNISISCLTVSSAAASIDLVSRSDRPRAGSASSANVGKGMEKYPIHPIDLMRWARHLHLT